MRDLKTRIREALGPNAPDDDILEELATHAATAIEGCDDPEARERLAALIATWRSDAAGLRRRQARPAAIAAPPSAAGPWTGLAHDVRYAARLIARRPGYAAIAMLTMALGIAASTTLFSVTYGVLLKPLPWFEPARLVRLSESRQGHEPRVKGTITNGTYIAWHAQPSTIEEIGGYRIVQATAVVGGGEPTRLQTAVVTPSLFTVLRAAPLRGRVLVEDDGRPGGSYPSKDVVVLSYGLWQERFGGRDDAIGAVVHIGGKPTTVVGVMPRDFVFPTRDTRAWTPWAVPSVLADKGMRRIAIFQAIARLRPGATPAQASAEGTSRARSAPDPGLAAVAMFGGNGPAEIAAVPAVEMMTAEVRPALLALLGGAALLLAIATANVASLQLARATMRRREIAVRAALGAGAGRLTRQLVVESALIGLGGGAAGLVLALALNRVLPSVLPADFPRVADVVIDLRVLVFAMAVTVASAVACGLLPALQARRLDLVASLADAGAAPVGLSLRTPAARARTAIIVGQLAISCVLLVGAALLTRSFVALLRADRGYDPRRVLTARLVLPSGFSVERRTQLLESVVARFRAIPGVTDAAYANALPLLTAGGFRASKMRLPVDPSRDIDVNMIQRVVSPGYFGALGLRVIAGRALDDGDTLAAPKVIVVNRSFAAKYLGRDPLRAVVPNLGMCRGDNDQWQVVGVIDDMRQGAVGDPPQPEVFHAYPQVGCAEAVADPVVVVRSSDDPSSHAGALRALVREQAPSVAVDSVLTMEDRLTTSLARPRLYAVVLAGFGVFALVITAVGLFGVLSYGVAQRTREIAVRTALGARPARIVALVARQVAMLSAAGVAIGLTAAWAAVQSIAKVLYGVSERDPATFAGVALLIAGIAAVATIVPARRAASIDPLEVLRAE